MEGCGGKAANSAGFHLGYRPWLDGLRGLAVLAVLAGHLHLVPGGFLGVDLFLVLSGFLITSLLVQEWQRCGCIRFKHFYLRRVLRLGPAFAALLLACWLATWLLGSAAEAAAFRKEMAVAVCYLANWPTLHGVPMFLLGHTWSLSLEEQFYLLWPVLLYGMLRAGLARGRILSLVGLGILASATLRAVLCGRHLPPYPERTALVYRLYCGLDTRADALLVGCLVGLLATWELLPKSGVLLRGLRVAAPAAAGVLVYMVLTSSLEHVQFYRGVFTLVALLVAVILVRLLAAPSRPAAAVLESAFLVGIGRISYGLYLFHMPIVQRLRPERLGCSAATAALLAAALSFAAAVLSFYAIERPFLRLKDRFQTAGPAAAASARGLPPARAA